jgi:hypothetical protein
MTTILDALLASVRDDAAVRSVTVGARCTAVCSRRCGLASTLTGCRTARSPRRRRLHEGRQELPEHAIRECPGSIGMAA